MVADRAIPEGRGTPPPALAGDSDAGAGAVPLAVVTMLLYLASLNCRRVLDTCPPSILCLPGYWTAELGTTLL